MEQPGETPAQTIERPTWSRRALDRLIALLKRYPKLLALAGFLSGLASFVLVERKPALAQVVAVLMLASWLWLMFENTLRRNALRLLKLKVPRPALHFITQMVHQESLFFVLPFFFFTVTWNSGQTLFMGLLCAAALVSVLDPLYYNHLAQRRWLFLGFHALALFAVMLTALPIILHLSTAQSYPLALGIAVLLAIPSVISALPPRRWWRSIALVGVVVTLGAAGWYGRLWVPPATLWLTQVALSTDINIQDKSPGNSVKRLTETQLHQKGLYAYTAIRAPRGLNERIYHVWRLNGEIVDTIALDIQGGRKEGYRAWTHKRHFPERAVGDWQVQVITEAQQMIGVLRFEVTAIRN
ncbi:DUF2914 domain-containing protein [Marinimicrobium sp. C6131]|uniref:DUF5924 family protein n=1 Tax=Marinimicrobium sp. C6131 TaxID=3022676 RepID=UPI00223CE493|nr:DUF5924 family protein [Marinimicrobium sp. C6131]UZJ44872.1 DUF2914 domain-containing protein [Marinimicrobium sp. C6131]